MKILVAYDGSGPADEAIEDLRKAGIGGEAEVRVVCIEDGGLAAAAPDDGGATEADASWSFKVIEAERLARLAGERIQSYFPRWGVSFEGLLGTPAKTVLKTAQRWHPDLLVVGSHGRSGLGRLLLGSVSVNLVHHAPCSVRVARIGGVAGVGAPHRIVVGTDGSKEAEAVVRLVAARSWPDKTEAQIVSVVQTLVPAVSALEANTFAQEAAAFNVITEADKREWDRLRGVVEQSAGILRSAGLIVTSRVVDGDPGEAIVSAAETWNADAIFVGARGLGRIERLLLGSVSTYVVTHARCTVEVVRPGV